MPQENKGRTDEREMPEETGQAVESGEHGETGRARGRVIDRQGDASGPAAEKSIDAPEKGEGQHWESGRQQAGE